jgi:lipopolysaccharide/colanic/teichoic acid biosynthesis glycosyltransferase
MKANSQTAGWLRTSPGAGHPLLALVFDKTFAFLGLIVLTPVMLLVALSIVVDTGFPILFSQDRLGQNGRRFRMYKFRKFPARGLSSTLPVTLANDSRFTRVGKFIEKTKLDEVPQLWNVLRGDMAIVGPRPEVPDFAECYRGPARRVLDYRPGIFGPGQALFRDEGTLYPPGGNPTEFYREVLFPAKASLDLSYYPSRSFIRDLKWIMRCLLAIAGVKHRDGITSQTLSLPNRLPGNR